MSHAQAFYVGLMGGGQNYQGELQQYRFDSKHVRGVGGVSGLYAVSSRVSMQAELTAGFLSAKDNANNLWRNLSFQTHIYELSLMGRYNFFYNRDIFFSPYVSAGISSFYVNPFVIDQSGAKTFLYPLGLEGQGLRQYPDRPVQTKLNYAIPFASGIEFRLTERARLDFEVSFRKTFTDYLDDVGGFYPEESVLLAAKGPKAVELSYRADEVPGQPLEYPSNMQRGGQGTADWYNAVTVRLRVPLIMWDLAEKNESYIFRKRGWPYRW